MGWGVTLPNTPCRNEVDFRKNNVARPHRGGALNKSLTCSPMPTLDLLYLRLVVAPPHTGSALDKSLNMQPDADTLDLLHLRLGVARPHRGSAQYKSLSMQPHADTLDLLYFDKSPPPRYDIAQASDR